MKPIIISIFLLCMATHLQAQKQELFVMENPHEFLPPPTENEATSPQKLQVEEATSWLHAFRQFAAPYFIKPNCLMAVLGDEGIVLDSETPGILKLIIPAEYQEIPDNFIWKNDTWLLKFSEDTETGEIQTKGMLGGMPVYTSCQLVSWDGQPFILFEFEQANH